LALLILASIFAFRTWRDAWFLCVVSVAIIAAVAGEKREADEPVGLPAWAGVAVASILLLFLVARNTDFNTPALDRTISSEYPVDAVNFCAEILSGSDL